MANKRHAAKKTAEAYRYHDKSETEKGKAPAIPDGNTVCAGLCLHSPVLTLSARVRQLSSFHFFIEYLRIAFPLVVPSIFSARCHYARQAGRRKAGKTC